MLSKEFYIAIGGVIAVACIFLLVKMMHKSDMEYPSEIYKKEYIDKGKGRISQKW